MKITIKLERETGDRAEVASLSCRLFHKGVEDYARVFRAFALAIGFTPEQVAEAFGVDPAPIAQELLETTIALRQSIERADELQEANDLLAAGRRDLSKPGPMQMSTETVMPLDKRLTTGTGPEVDCSGVFTTGDSPTAEPAPEKPPTQILNVAGIDAGAFSKLGKANGINADIAQRLNKLVNDPHFQNYAVFASGKSHAAVMDAVQCAVEYVQATAFTPSFDALEPIKFSEKAYWVMVAAFEAWAKDQGITLE